MGLHATKAISSAELTCTVLYTKTMSELLTACTKGEVAQLQIEVRRATEAVPKEEHNLY